MEVRRRGLILAVLCTILCITQSLEISREQINEAARAAKDVLRQRREAAMNTAHSKLYTGKAIITPSGCPFARSRHVISRSSNKVTKEVREEAALFEETSKQLVKLYGIKSAEDYADLRNLSFAGTELAAAQEQCRQRENLDCRKYVYDPYRTADGRCNNLNNPHWGRAGSCMTRMLLAAYDDGVSTPRGSGLLPNPRLVSSTVHIDQDIPARFTHITMQFGQFLDHDFALAPLEQDPGEIINLGNPNNPIDCCSPDKRNLPECFSFDIPSNDRFYSPYGETCMNFPRSAPCSFCGTGKREQFDILTSFIDGSQIYGSNEEDTKRLRAFTRGYLKFQVVDGKPLLPRSFHPDRDRCSDPAKGQFCFRAGDERVNEQPGLTVMHTIWLRQHNLIASQLRKMYPRLSDYKLFQEARRIVIAQFQNIVYREFLPLVLGPRITQEDFDLRPRTRGYTTYSPFENPTMMNEFAAAAYRFGHTLIQGTFKQITNRGSSSTFELQNFFFFPFEIYNGHLDRILNGLISQPAQSFDRFIVDDVTNHLYRLRNESFGLDLIALNVQRGRDHGLRPYVDYLKFCLGVDVRTFSDLQSLMSSDAIRSLQQVYRRVQDVDLFPGGISEYSVEGGVVGPTFACIFGNMFEKLRYGDRYYYEHGHEAGSFQEDQLREIRKTTLARIICDNSDNITSVQPNVFLPPDNYRNRIIDCRSIPQTDLRHWRY